MGEFAVRSGPPRARLLGREGVGRTVLAAALRARSVDVFDGAADAHVYLFAGGLRATDRIAVDSLSRGIVPLIVVWSKADAAGSWCAADEYASGVAQILSRPVLPVMALLDGALDTDVPALRAIAESGVALPDSVSEAARVLADDVPLLHRLGGYGVGCAVGALRERPDLGDGEVVSRIRELSGVSALTAELDVAFTGHEERRDAEYEDALRRAVVSEPGRRDQAERLLLDRLAGR